MKIRKMGEKALAIAAVSAMLVSPWASGASPVKTAEAKKKTVLVMGKTDKSLVTGDKKGVKYTYRSSNSKKASVTSNGVVKARKKGKVSVIRYKTRNQKTTIDKVKQYNIKKLKVSGQKIIYVNGKYKYKVNTSGVKWKVNSKTKAKVTKKGVLTAKQAGTVTLTASLKSSKKVKSKKKLTIRPDGVKSIKASYTGTYDSKKPLDITKIHLTADYLSGQSKSLSGSDAKIEKVRDNPDGSSVFRIIMDGYEQLVRIDPDGSVHMLDPYGNEIKGSGGSQQGSGSSGSAALASVPGGNGANAGSGGNGGSGGSGASGGNGGSGSSSGSSSGGSQASGDSGSQTGAENPGDTGEPVVINYDGEALASGDSIDLSKVHIRLRLPDGTYVDIPSGDVTIVADVVEGNTRKITVTYQYEGTEHTETFTVPYLGEPVSIEVIKPVRSVLQGGELKFDEMEIDEVFADGTKRPVYNYTADYDPKDTSIGERTVKIGYKGLETQMQLEVQKLKVIELRATAPTVPTIQGGGLNTQGLTVTALYENGTSDVVTGYQTDYSPQWQPGGHNLTITFEEGSTTVQMSVVEPYAASASVGATYVGHPLTISTNADDTSYAIAGGEGSLSAAAGRSVVLTPTGAGTVSVTCTRGSTGEQKSISVGVQDYGAGFTNTAAAGSNYAKGDSVRVNVNAPSTATFVYMMGSTVYKNNSYNLGEGGSMDYACTQEGDINITVKDNISGKTIQRTIKVRKELNITGPGSVKVGQSITIKTSKNVVNWSLSNGHAALSKGSGSPVTLKGKSAGTVVITATFPEYANRTFTKTITVKKK